VGKREKIFITWIILALVVLMYVTNLFKGSFPLFTIVWLCLPLIVVLCTKDAAMVGFKLIPLKEFFKVTLINFCLSVSIIGIFEPWSHTYQLLIKLATDSTSPDVTFAWLIRYSGLASLIGMFLFSGFITMFGEELFFRGWLLQYLKSKMNNVWAIILQAAFFVLPNIIAALFMPITQGIIYTVVYAWVAIGIVGGWSANRTNSIWPSLISANIINLIAVILYY